MGVQYVGAPRFLIKGNAARIREKAAALRRRADNYSSVAASLRALSTDGWTGRAAERFREHFEVDPPRWQEAASGFYRASSALGWYAKDLRSAQIEADECKAGWEEAECVTARAKAAWEADVARAKRAKEAWEEQNGPDTYHLTIAPFEDPGEELRRRVIARFNSLVKSVDATAQLSADWVRKACVNTPKKRNWWQSAWANFAGFFKAGFDTVTEFANFVTSPFRTVVEVATGDLTMEEAATKGEMAVEDIQALASAFAKDPVAFGKEMFKELTSWDRWKDDPSGAAGSMLTNMGVAAVGGGGLLGAGKKLTKLTDKADGMAGAAKALKKPENIKNISKTSDNIEDIANLEKKTNNGDGPVVFKVMKNSTDEQVEQYKKYVDGANRALERGELSKTGRVSTKGRLRDEASDAAQKERKEHPKKYEGKVVGHIPDTTWTGRPNPPEWGVFDAKVNSSLGGASNKYPIGYKPTKFYLDDGKGELYG